jgi:superfamily I DNA/RNA helicase
VLDVDALLRPDALGEVEDLRLLYRKHKHRDAILARLREESIPATVLGGLSLFATPEIRDLEQALRAIADPFDDVALTRVLTAGPWRLDALELLAITRAAKRAGRHILELVRDAAGSGEVTLHEESPWRASSTCR